MRLSLPISLAAITAVIAGAGAGSSAELQTPRPPPVVVGYNLTAAFTASLLVSWSLREGDRSDPCSAWAETNGLNKVNARSVKPVKGYLQIYRRGFQRTRSGPVASWGSLVAVGKAKGTIERSLDQQSGVNGGAGCGQRYRFPPTTCGERLFTTRSATLLATWRVFNRTLDPRDSDPTVLAGLSEESIDFTITPSRDPFSTCDIPSYAKAFPVDVGLRVRDRDWDALRALKRGKSYELSHRYGGRCTEALPARDCAFVLDLSVTIKRTT